MINDVQIGAVGSQADIMLIKIRGFLDTVVAYRLQAKVNTLIEAGIFKYIINLEELEHISSAGIGLFSSMALELQKHQGKIIFTNVPEQVHHLFKTTRLAEIFPIRESIKEAVTAIESAENSV
jgi:anti-sigma B factor antagonist